MKKKKLFVLLPLVALLLSSCGYSITPWDAPEEDDEALGEYTPSESENPESSGDTGSGSGGDGGETPGGDTGGGKNTPTITYSVSIDEDGLSPLEIGDTKTVNVYLITTEDGVPSSVLASESNVTLTAGDSSVLEVSGLTIKALKDGTSSLTATWTSQEVTSDPVYITVNAYIPETSYAVEIVTDGDGLTLTEEETLAVSVKLYTKEDGETISSEDGTISSVSLSATPEGKISISEDELSITGISSGEAYLTATWTAKGVSDTVKVTINEKEIVEIPEEHTYLVEITNTDLSELTVGDQKIVSVMLYDYVEDDLRESKEGDSETVTLSYEGNEGIISIDGLTITAIGAGNVTLKAEWNEHNATSAGTYISVSVAHTTEWSYGISIDSIDGLDNENITIVDDTSQNVHALTITLTTYVTYDGTQYTYETHTAESGEVELSTTNATYVDVNSSNLTITVKEVGSATITATWTDHANGDGTGDVSASKYVNVIEGRTPAEVFIEELQFDQSSYNLTIQGGVYSSTNISVSVTQPEELKDSTAYYVYVADDSIAKYADGVLTAVAAGDTYIVARANDGGDAIGYAEVHVSFIATPVTSISVSSTSLTLSVDESATIGSASAEGSANYDISVSLYPDNADDLSWALKETDDNGYLVITGESAPYTVSVNQSIENLGASELTATLVAYSIADNVESEAINVTISEVPSIAHPVTSISLSGSNVSGADGEYTTIISCNDTLTIGDSDTDIVATVNSDAYDTTWSVEVSSNDSSTVSLNYANGIYTLTVIATDITEKDGRAATLIFTATGDSTVSATLTITILREEEVAASISAYSPNSLSIQTNSTASFDLSLTVLNQYNEQMSGLTYTLSIENQDPEEVSLTLSATSGTDGTYTIDCGSISGSANLVVKVDDAELSVTIPITISETFYEPDAISYSDSEVTLGYNLDETIETISTYTFDESKVTYSSAYGNVDDQYKGVTLSISDNTQEYISLDTETGVITALKPTPEGQGVEVTISANYGNATTSFTVYVQDNTDYSPKDLSLVDSNGDLVSEVEMSVSDLEGDTKTLVELGVSVEFGPSWVKDEDRGYTITSSNLDVVTVDGDNITALASKLGGQATLTVSSTSNSALSATLTVNVTTSYVAATEISISGAPNEIEVGETLDLSSYISVGPSNATYKTYTLESDNEAIVVDGTSIYAASAATDVTITATTVDGYSDTLTISAIEPLPSVVTGYSLSLSFTGSLNSSGQLNIIGDWMNGQSEGNWNLNGTSATLSRSGTTYTYQITSGEVELGTTYHFAILASYTNAGSTYWYTARIIYEGAVTVSAANEGNNTSDYTNVVASVNTGVNLSSYISSSNEQLDFSVALENTGTGGLKSGSFYIDGYPENSSNYKGAQSDWTSYTMSSYSGSNYTYNYYYDFGTCWGNSNDNLSFTVAADEWEGDLLGDGLRPTTAFKNILGQEASDGTPFAKYITWNEWESSWDDNGQTMTESYGYWDLLFWDMVDNTGINPLIYMEDFTIVLQLDFSSVSYENWSADYVVTGFYCIVNGNVVSALSV